MSKSVVLSLLILVVVGVGFATQSQQQRVTIEVTKEKPLEEPDLKYETRRVYSEVSLESKLATSVAKEVDKVCSDESASERLAVVAKHFGLEGLECTSWTYQVKSVKEGTNQSTEIHVDVTPTMLYNGAPAAIMGGAIEECWIVDANSKLVCQTSSVSPDAIGIAVD